jgi:hypothetical protein
MLHRTQHYLLFQTISDYCLKFWNSETKAVTFQGTEITSRKKVLIQKQLFDILLESHIPCCVKQNCGYVHFKEGNWITGIVGQRLRLWNLLQLRKPLWCFVCARSGCNLSTQNIFDVHVTVHRVKFLKIKPTRCTNFSNLFLKWNSTCFRQFLCPSSGVFHCTHSNGICHTGLLTACEQDQDGVPSCQQTCMTYHCYMYSEELRMTEELSETCRVSFQE